MTKDAQTEQGMLEESTTVFGRSLITGFTGGVIWSFLGFIMYYFNFSEVSAKTFILRSWSKANWTERWLGDFVSILLVGVLSIVVAMIYYGLLRKAVSKWTGLVYGLILWVVVFYVLHPIFANIHPLIELDKRTIVSTLCLFALYGIFIGYSISYDYYDTQFNDMQNKHAIK